jgi:hypothetical protein
MTEAIDRLIHWQARDKGFTADQLEVGTPACISIGSDTYPATVTEVKENDRGVRAIVVEELHKRGPGIFVETGEHKTFTLRRDGCFREKGRDRGYQLSIGLRAHDLDPSF